MSHRDMYVAQGLKREDIFKAAQKTSTKLDDKGESIEVLVHIHSKEQTCLGGHYMFRYGEESQRW